MAALKSTRLSIVEQSVKDILERLNEIPESKRVRELRTRAQAYERAVRSWEKRTPGPDQRAAMLKFVLELHVEVMAVVRAHADNPPPSASSE